MHKIKTVLLIGGLLLAFVAGAVESADTVVKTSTIDEVVVTGTRNATDMRHLPMRVSVVNKAQIEARHEQSLLPVLTEHVPGLFVTGRGVMGYGISTGAAGGLSLRGIGGSPTTRMLMLIDGQPQYAGLMGHPVADAYQSMLAEKVEVLRGPASVLYGSNAMGGVINIVTDQKRQDGVHTDVNLSYGSYNTFNAEAVNHIRKGKLGTTVGLSYNRSDGHRENMDFEQYTGFAKLSYDLTKHWQTSANVDLTQFEASNPGLEDAPMIDNDSKITRGMASVALSNNYDRTSGALRIYYNWGNHKINDGYEVGEQPLDYHFHSKDQMAGISLYQSVSFFKGNRVTAGVDYQYIQGEAWNLYLENDSSAFLADKQEQEIAAYVDFRQDLGSFFTIDLGIRADNHTQSGLEWVPQFGLSTHLPLAAELKLSASKGFRNPTIKELYMFRSQNPELEPERIWNYELSLSQRLMGGKFTYGANVFYLKGDNLIQTVSVGGRPTNINTGEVENYGAEAEASYRINENWAVNANYSFLHMENPVVAAPEHKTYLGGSFGKGRWMAASGIQYVAGLYTSIEPEEKESYILWNARVSFQATKWLNLYVRGENLLAQEYEINAGYPMPKATVFGGLQMKF